jgi:alkaline phosphatase
MQDDYMRYGRTKTWLSLLAALSLILWAGLASAQLPQNVILMISDGMGYNTVKATDYWTGAPAVYENFLVKFGMSTFSAGTPGHPAIGYDPGQAWNDFNYVKTPGSYTDSASATTAMATGVKIYDNVLNIDTTGNRLKTITEIARDLGKSSGVVTTVQWSHATPAGMFAHNLSRDNYFAIANEMLGSASPLNVIMGAGNPDFNDDGQPASRDAKYVGGAAIWKRLKTGAHPTGWSLIQTRKEFETLASNPHPTVTKVVGTVQAHTTTQQARTLDVKGADSANPSGVAYNPNVPSLATMTRAALNVLCQNPRGFFLMVEGGAVDWASHNRQLGRMIEEQMDFNAAVQAVVAWVTAHGSWDNTLLIVTSDHETGYLWGPGGPFSPLFNHGAGTLPGATYNSGGHTNSLVPLFAKGAGAHLLAGYADQSDPVRGWYVDNTEIFKVMNGIRAVPIPGTARLPGYGLVDLGLFRRQARAHLN